MVVLDSMALEFPKILAVTCYWVTGLGSWGLGWGEAGSQGRLKGGSGRKGVRGTHGGPGDGVCPQGPRPRWSRPWGHHEVLPTWPRPLWEEPTVLSYHHRGKAYGGNQAQPLSWPLGLVPPCSASLAKGLIWEGALSQAAGPCPPRAHTPGQPGAPIQRRRRAGETVRAEDREGRKGGFQGVGPSWPRPAGWAGRGFRAAVWAAEKREKDGGKRRSALGFEKPHCATWRRRWCGGVGNKPEEERNKRWADVWKQLPGVSWLRCSASPKT